MNHLPWEIRRIIEVAIDFKTSGYSPASTGEKIAAAFVLNDQRFLPEAFDDMVEAWDRLGPQWQNHVRRIKAEHMHLIEAG